MRGGGARGRHILLALLVAVSAAGCVVGSQRMIGTGDLILDRQRLGRVQQEQLGEIRSKFKAGNIDGSAVNAEVIAITAMQIPSLFPDGPLSDRSRAKPEIWQRWSEFEASAKNLTIWSRASSLRGFSQDHPVGGTATSDLPGRSGVGKQRSAELRQPQKCNCPDSLTRAADLRADGYAWARLLVTRGPR